MTTDTYPQAKYEIWLDTPTGTRLALLESFSSISYARKRSNVGRGAVVLPADLVDPRMVKEDALVEIWRTVYGCAPHLDFAGLVRQIRYNHPDREDILTLVLEDGNSLLRDRLVAYRTGGTKTEKWDYADDAMKEVVRENLGASASDAAGDTTRRLDGWGFDVEPDVTAGPYIEITFPWKYVLDALSDMSDMAYQEGNQVWFDVQPYVVSNTQIGWRFRTFTGQVGADRTYESGHPVVFGPEWGNLDNPDLTLDYTQEFSTVYAVGQGEDVDRFVQVAQDDLMLAKSPWARREHVTFWPVEANKTHLLKWARRELVKGRPRVLLSGSLKDTPQSRYGVDWGFGDRVEAAFRRYQFTAHVDAVGVMVNQSGQENITASIRAECTI